MKAPSFGRSARNGVLPCAALAFAALWFNACADSTAPSSANLNNRSPVLSKSAAGSVPDQYIVVLDDDVTDVRGRANALMRVHGGTVRAEYQKAFKGFSANMKAEAAARIAATPGVRHVEQDQIMSATGTQTSAPWGLDRIDQSALPLDGSYSYASLGGGVNAYIIDAGIRRTHSQFGGRVVAAFSAIADGYGADGCHWHGTHVAGTVGGTTAGVAKGVTLHSVRVLDCSAGGTASSVIAGVEWVTANHRKPAVANVSISGGASSALNLAVQNSINAGVTYVVAAGNAASDACSYSPASAAAAITVGATTNTDVQAGFSNWGACVDIQAPGQNVLSAWHTDDGAMGTSSGTSMAAPHVAGAAVLYLAANPTASPASVSQAILSGATSGVVSGLFSGSPNRLLRIGTGGGSVVPPPPPSPPPPPPPPVNAPPRASFDYSCQKNACVFRSTSTDDVAIVSYAWTFGDGGTSASANPSYVYRSKGSFVATLTVRDAAGSASSMQQMVSIKTLSR